MTEKVEFRILTAEMIPAVVEMVAKAVPELPAYKNMRVSRERIEFVLRNNLNNALFFCLIACDSHGVPHGGIAGMVTMTSFSMDMVANDIFFYVEEEYRSLHAANHLFAAYTKWAQARKCVLIMASHRSGERGDAIGRILQRHGYVPVGTNYFWRPRDEERANVA